MSSELVKKMRAIQARDVINGSNGMMTGGHATTNDAIVAGHMAHAVVAKEFGKTTKELGQTARTGFRTVDHISGSGWWAELHPVGKTIIILAGIAGVVYIAKLILDRRDNKIQVAGVQTTDGKQFEETKLGELKALPPGTAQQIDWNALQHHALANMASSSRETIEFLVNTAKQVIKESK
jgi:hypothetical protein